MWYFVYILRNSKRAQYIGSTNNLKNRLRQHNAALKTSLLKPHGAFFFMYNKNMSWYLYIAQARTGIYYTGITTNPERRIQDHNKGKGSSLAKAQGPFTLIYTSPPFPDQSAARKQEIQVKSWPRKKKEKLIRGDSVFIPQ